MSDLSDWSDQSDKAFDSAANDREATEYPAGKTVPTLADDCRKPPANRSRGHKNTGKGSHSKGNL